MLYNEGHRTRSPGSAVTRQAWSYSTVAPGNMADLNFKCLCYDISTIKPFMNTLILWIVIYFIIENGQLCL